MIGFAYCFTDAREQVLGNLANFAYDPINYEYMRQLNVIDLFLGEYLNHYVSSLYYIDGRL